VLCFSVTAAAQIPAQPTTPPGRPGAGADTTTTTPGTTPKETVGLAVDPNHYIIGAEDVLSISVWREPNFTIPAEVVRPDGKITMPLIGEVQAAGLTPLQLTKSLTEKLTTYINRPEVTIGVAQVRSRKYYIDGLVNKPGPYPLATPTRVLEALSEAGGFQEWANTRKIKILRGNQTFRFNYKEAIKGKHPEQNIELENGDHIIVP